MASAGCVVSDRPIFPKSTAIVDQYFTGKFNAGSFGLNDFQDVRGKVFEVVLVKGEYRLSIENREDSVCTGHNFSGDVIIAQCRAAKADRVRYVYSLIQKTHSGFWSFVMRCAKEDAICDVKSQSELAAMADRSLALVKMKPTSVDLFIRIP
jgi:hypothetical protein